MSWQTYVDDHLLVELPVSGGKLTHAAIIGHDGGVWAQSAEFPAFTPEQMTDLITGVDDPNKLATTGIKLADAKYFLIPSEAGAVLRGRFKSDGIIVKKTAQTVVIGIYSEPVPAGEASVRVEDLGNSRTWKAGGVDGRAKGVRGVGCGIPAVERKQAGSSRPAAQGSINTSTPSGSHL